MKLERTLTAAGATVPQRLEALLALLAGGSWHLLDPDDRDTLHPLLIPLARDDQGATVGFLRWPTAPPEMPLPIVRQEGHTLSLVAGSADELLRRELATRDAHGEDATALLAAANRPGRLYETGDLAMTGLPLKAFLLLQVGVNHDFFEELVELHLEKGDERAAVITSERSCRQASGWSRPHAFRAHLLERLGRSEEAADAARTALLEPVWTLGPQLFEPLARLAGWKDPIGPWSYEKLAEKPDASPLDRAAHLMDATTVARRDWKAIRPVLAELYASAGLEPLAHLVRG